MVVHGSHEGGLVLGEAEEAQEIQASPSGPVREGEGVKLMQGRGRGCSSGAVAVAFG